MELKLVRQSQLPGEPYHWSLFLAAEDQKGAVFQVKGDSTSMRFTHTENIDILYFPVIQ